MSATARVPPRSPGSGSNAVVASATVGHRSRNFDHFCLATPRDQYNRLRLRFQQYPFIEVAKEMAMERKVSPHSAASSLRSSLAAYDYSQQRCPAAADGNDAAEGCPAEEDPAAAGAEAGTRLPSPTSPTMRLPAAALDSGAPAEASRAGSSASLYTSPRTLHRASSVWSWGDEPLATPQTPASPGGRKPVRHTWAEGRGAATTRHASRRTSSTLGMRSPRAATSGAGAGPHRQFEHWCVQKFGSLVRLWRCLDTHDNMRIGQGHFLRGLQDLGYPGDARELFGVLNRDQTGTLLFYHFHPQAAIHVAELLHWARSHYGGLQGLGLTSAMDQNNSRVTRGQFRRLFKKKGWEGGEKAIDFAFELVDRDGDGSVNRTEMGVLDRWEFPEWLSVEPDEAAAEGLKAQLLGRCQGNALRAWRLLDRNGSMRLSWHDFRQALRRLLPGEDQQERLERLPAAWRALDDDLSGWLSFQEFDKDAHDALSRFWHWAVGACGSVVAAFPKLQQAGGEGAISHYEFRLGCKASGLGEEVVEMIFEGLDVDGTGTISLNEVRFLDAWKATDPGGSRAHSRAHGKLQRMQSMDSTAVGGRARAQRPAAEERKRFSRLQTTDCVMRGEREG